MSPSSAKPGSDRAAPCATDLDDLPHQPARGVQVVDRHVDEEPAGPGEELGPRRAHVPQRGAEEVDVAELAGPDPLGRGHPVRVEAAVEADLQHPSGPADRVEGGHAGGPVQRHRLLAEHVPARPRRAGDELRVRGGRRRQRDGVHIGQQVLVRGRRRHAQLGADPRSHAGVGVRHRDQAGGRAAPGQVRRVDSAHPAEPGQPDPQPPHRHPVPGPSPASPTRSRCAVTPRPWPSPRSASRRPAGVPLPGRRPGPRARC